MSRDGEKGRWSGCRRVHIGYCTARPQLQPHVPPGTAVPLSLCRCVHQHKRQAHMTPACMSSGSVAVPHLHTQSTQPFALPRRIRIIQAQGEVKPTQPTQNTNTPCR